MSIQTAWVHVGLTAYDFYESTMQHLEKKVMPWASGFYQNTCDDSLFALLGAFSWQRVLWEYPLGLTAHCLGENKATHWWDSKGLSTFIKWAWRVDSNELLSFLTLDKLSLLTTGRKCVLMLAVHPSIHVVYVVCGCLMGELSGRTGRPSGSSQYTYMIT